VKRNRYVAIIQARMGSSRLPGKCMLPIDNCGSVIEYIIRNISLSEYIDEICVAFPATPDNEPILALCNTLKSKYGKPVYWYSGSENDVLDRITQASNYFKAAYSDKVSDDGELIAIEITADCPFVSAFTIDNMCRLMDNNPEIDYTSNTVTRCWPDGFDIQVYSLDVLQAANRVLTSKNKHREHGGWNIVNYSLSLVTNLRYFITIVNYAPIQEECFRPELSVTLDTEEDYQTILRIVDFLKIDTDEKRRNIDLRVLVTIIDNPDLLTNKDIVRKIPGV